jgi:hypothetical protein
MRLTAIEVTTVAGQKVRLELDVPIGEDLKGFDFSRWFHHFWIHYGRYLDGPLPRVVTPEGPKPRIRAWHGESVEDQWWFKDYVAHMRDRQEFDRGGFGR